MTGRFLLMTACSIVAVTLMGCNRGVQTPAKLQHWKTPSKEGYLRVVVRGGTSNLEDIAIGPLRGASVPEAVLVDKFQREYSNKDLQEAGVKTPQDYLTLRAKVGEAFRSVKQTLVETQVIQNPGGGVTAYGLYEISREDMKQATGPVVRGLAKANGWDEEKVVKVVNEAISAIKSDATTGE